MSQNIGFYNKHLLCNNSYLKKYHINNIVRYSLDNNIKNTSMNNLIDIYLDINYYNKDANYCNIKKKNQNRLPPIFLKKNKVTFSDKCNNTSNIEKCECSTNTINKIVYEKSTNTGKEMPYKLKPILKKSNQPCIYNNYNASIINRIKVNEKLRSSINDI